jgi:hypothetical protein
VGPRTGLDVVVERKIPSPRRESNSSRPARSLVAIPTELSLSVATEHERAYKFHTERGSYV